MGINLRFSHKILLAAALVVAAAFSLFTYYNDHLQRNALRANLENHLAEVGQISASNIQAWLSGRILLAESIADLVVLSPSVDAAKVLFKQRSQASTFTATYLGKQNGQFITRSDDPMPEGYDPRTRPWYQGAMSAGGTTLTSPYVDASSGQLTITIATPVPSLGVVGADLSLDAITNIINALDLNGLGYAFLISADGKVLVHPNRDMVLKGLQDVFPQQTPKIGSTYNEVQVDGGTRIVAFTPVKGLPSVSWYIGISIDKAKAYQALSDFRTSAIIATVVAMVLIIILLSMLIRALMQPLYAMGSAMKDIAQGEGDLTRRLAVHAQDEFGELADAFNRFVERIHTSICEVSSATTRVNQVARLVLNASNSSLGNSDDQAHRTSSVAAAINELGAAAQEIARNAADASHRASSARSLAEDGLQVVERTITSMNELSERIRTSCNNIETLNGSTTNIGQILAVIKSISEQTNLLALNAAIEAARAGDAGRGFAVVADEVRSLAHRTQESTQEIQQMILELQDGAREAVATMTESQRYSELSVEIANKAGERLGSVTKRIGEIDGMNQSVAAATEEQTAVVDSLNIDITQINSLNQTGVENLNSTLKACAELNQQAERLQHLVGSFRI